MNADLLKEQGLFHALSYEKEKIKKLERFEIETGISGEPIFMDFQKELFIFRIIQESFNNILKHSQASRIWLELHYNDTMLTVTVRDNGIGIGTEGPEPRKKDSAGILNMQKRAALIGGSCEIYSEPGAGATVILKVPY